MAVIAAYDTDISRRAGSGDNSGASRHCGKRYVYRPAHSGRINLINEYKLSGGNYFCAMVTGILLQLFPGMGMGRSGISGAAGLNRHCLRVGRQCAFLPFGICK